MTEHINQVLVDASVGEIVTVEGIGSWFFMKKGPLGCYPLEDASGEFPGFSTMDKAHEWLRG